MAKETIPEAIKTSNSIISKFLRSQNVLSRNLDGSWKLRAEYNSFVTNDTRSSHIIWPLPVRAALEQKASKYPFFMAVTIRLKANEEIRNFNIKVFKEDLTTPDTGDFKPTELMLRAEWDNDIKPKVNSDDDDLEGLHAQPHWHIHSYKVVDKVAVLNPDNQRQILSIIEDLSKEDAIANGLQNQSVGSILDEIGQGDVEHDTFDDATAKESSNLQTESIFDDTEQVVTNNISKVADTLPELPLFRFHLAMLADWDKDSGCENCKPLTNDVLRSWLPQCLNYIKIQFESILKKLPN